MSEFRCDEKKIVATLAIECKGTSGFFFLLLCHSAPSSGWCLQKCSFYKSAEHYTWILHFLECLHGNPMKKCIKGNILIQICILLIVAYQFLFPKICISVFHDKGICTFTSDCKGNNFLFRKGYVYETC